MIVCIGTIGLDTTRTPFKAVERVLGGAAVYTGISASFFSSVGLVGIIGGDFPEKYKKILESRLDLSGVKVEERGKTFFYDSTFDFGFTRRQSNLTELNVIENFDPEVPEKYKKSEFVYLANNDPVQNIKALDQFEKPRLTVCDTIEYWILNKRKEVKKMMSLVDVVVLNDDEIRLLCKEPNLIRAAREVLSWGCRHVIVKKGEHGSILINEELTFPLPGYPLENVVDPTGAGDSFAGGFLGHLSRKGNINKKAFKEALVYGNIMGSFAVEDFSINRFLNLKTEDIEKRYKEYRTMVNF